MKTVEVDAAVRYNIVIDKGILPKSGDMIKEVTSAERVAVITDDTVDKLYSDVVMKSLSDAGFETFKFVFPHGEKSKNISTFSSILEFLAESGLTRTDALVALGGGVVGDLAGFAAACYMRGIDFYNVPTTLLSQVDSSIGGKTAIDFCGVKNIMGAFYQPKGVIVDSDVLCTLDDRQFAAGLAEIIKMAATSDARLFELLENSDDIKTDIDEIVRRAIEIKRDVVEQDPTEKGLRKVLNFGHTVGHAIESVENGRLLHGECVALGMLPMCEKSVRVRLEKLLEKYGLPTKFVWSEEELRPYIKHDKKAAGEFVNVVRVKNIGSFEFSKETADEILKSVESVR